MICKVRERAKGVITAQSKTVYKANEPRGYPSGKCQREAANEVSTRETNERKEMYGKNSVNIDDAIILKSLYDSRKNYVQSLPESQYLGDGKITKQEKINIINKRYPKELQDALNYLK